MYNSEISKNVVLYFCSFAGVDDIYGQSVVNRHYDISKNRGERPTDREIRGRKSVKVRGEGER